MKSVRSRHRQVHLHTAPKPAALLDTDIGYRGQLSRSAEFAQGSSNDAAQPHISRRANASFASQPRNIVGGTGGSVLCRHDGLDGTRWRGTRPATAGLRVAFAPV